MITHPQVEQYIETLIPNRSDLLHRLEEEGRRDGIPNILLSSAQFMKVYLTAVRPKRILEIGTAIGYSTLWMAEAAPGAKIVTIEKDESRAARAMSHFREAGVSGRVQLLEGDALDLVPSLHPFDFIFIDASKGQYERFLEMSLNKLNVGGSVLVDNILFRGYVAQSPEEHSPEVIKRFGNMLHKLKAFNRFMADQPDLTTSWIPIGDGMALATKK